jgi:hypothetical protein
LKQRCGPDRGGKTNESVISVNPDNSSSFKLVQEGGFDITYLDGRNIQGDYFADTIVVGDGSIEKQQLGLALHSVRPTGIMGLGFGANVVADTVYPTIIDNLVKQGFIDYAAFSLYLVRLLSLSLTMCTSSS